MDRATNRISGDSEWKYSALQTWLWFAIRNGASGERTLGKSTAIVRLTQTDTHTREEGEDH